MWDIRMPLTQICVFAILLVKGVSGDGDEVKSVSVMEGDSVTLHTDVTELQTQDHVLWLSGPQVTRIAEVYYHEPSTYDETGRLSINSQTGSLTITDIRISDSGLHELQIINSRETLYKRFNVTVAVYDRLPVPITNQTLNTTRVCETCPDETGSRSHVCAITAAVLGVLVVLVMIVVAVKCYQISRESGEHSQIPMNDLNGDMRADRDEVS